jgi:hypothetical protein
LVFLSFIEQRWTVSLTPVSHVQIHSPLSDHYDFIFSLWTVVQADNIWTGFCSSQIQ